MEVNYKNEKDFTIEHGDMVKIGHSFYLVFEEHARGYRLNCLSGIGYYGNHQNKEELIEMLKSKCEEIEIFPKNKYRLDINEKR